MKTISRRTFLALGAGLGLAACRQPAAEPPTPAAPLVVYGWVGYLPDSIFAGFTQATGVPVDYQVYEAQEDALAQLRAGAAYDVVVLGYEYVREMADEGLIATLDFRNIPNFRNLAPSFRDLSFDPENAHSVPIEWGTTGLVIRTDRVAAPVMGWADLWDRRYAGRIGVWPYAGDLISIALQSLGYSANTTDLAHLQAARARLMALADQVYLLDANLPTAAPCLLDDKTVMVYGWSYDLMAAQEQTADVAYVLPKEGTILWADNLTVPSSSRQKRLAEQFIDFVLRPENSAAITNEIYVATANEAARPFITPEILANQAIFPPDEALAKAEFYTTLPPEVQAQHDAIWRDFLAHLD